MQAEPSSSARGIECHAGYAVRQVVAGSDFRTLNGLAIGPDGRVFVACTVGESLLAFDRRTGDIQTLVGPPLGASDDLVVTEKGDIIWTAVLEGIVRVRQADGALRDLAQGLTGINSIAFTRDKKRLFVGESQDGKGSIF